MFKDLGTTQIIFGTVNMVAIYLTARIEEKEMTVKFGGRYVDYMKDTKMFIPNIF